MHGNSDSCDQTGCAPARIGAGARRLAAAALFAAGVGATLPAAAADLTIVVDGIAQAVGTIQIAVYGNEASFRKEAVRALKLPAKAGSMTVRVPDLTPGDYAVMLFQDVDGNDKLDTNLLGIPKEPWGGSLGGKSVFGPPGWSDVRFGLEPGGATVRIKLD